MKRKRYAPQGLLALAPQAFGFWFDMFEPPSIENREGVAIVSVRGPLMHHPDWCFDSYDGIKSRVAEALEAKPKAIVLAIDSPGGLVSGCFETARDLRTICEAAGVPLYAYVDGCAASGGYALACAADHIAVSLTAQVGSIGVIGELVDATEQDAMFGLKFRLVTSGARKADGHPHQPLSDGAIAATQKMIDDMANVFFDHVAMSREMDALAVSRLEAGLMLGAGAVSAGLADEVATLDEFLATVASGAVPAKSTTNGENAMPTKASKDYEETVANLKKLAEGDDEDEAANAKKMLAALEDDGDDKGDGDSDAPPPDKKDGDDKDARSARVPANLAGELGAVVSAQGKQIAELRLKHEASERSAFLATRPDLDAALVKVLKEKPLADVQAIVNAIPKSAPKPAAAAQPAITPTRGATQSDASRPSQISAELRAGMNRAMGLTPTKLGVVDEGGRLVLGASVPNVATPAPVPPPAAPTR